MFQFMYVYYYSTVVTNELVDQDGTGKPAIL